MPLESDNYSNEIQSKIELYNFKFLRFIKNWKKVDLLKVDYHI